MRFQRIRRLLVSLFVLALAIVVPSAPRAFAAVDNYPYSPSTANPTPTVSVDPYGTVTVSGTAVGPTDDLTGKVEGILLLNGSNEAAASTVPLVPGRPYTLSANEVLKPGQPTEVVVELKVDDPGYSYKVWPQGHKIVYDQSLTPPALMPLAPTFNDATSKVFIPSQLDVTYTINGVVKSSGWYAETGRVDVVASSNYVTLTNNTWTHVFGSPVVPTKPHQQVLPGPNNDIIVLPTVSGVSYTCTGWTKGVDVCTATVIATGAKVSWTFYDTNTPYPLIKHPVYCNTQSGRLQQGAAVGNPNVILVGNIFTIGGKWDEKLAVKMFGDKCPSLVVPPTPHLQQVTAVNGTFSDACGPTFNATFNAAVTTGVKYVVTRQGNTLTVEAQNADSSKYVLTNPQWSQSYTDKLLACPVNNKPPTTNGNGGNKGGHVGNNVGSTVKVSTPTTTSLPLPPHSGAEGSSMNPVGMGLEGLGVVSLLCVLMVAARKGRVNQA